MGRWPYLDVACRSGMSERKLKRDEFPLVGSLSPHSSGVSPSLCPSPAVRRGQRRPDKQPTLPTVTAVLISPERYTYRGLEQGLPTPHPAAEKGGPADQTHSRDQPWKRRRRRSQRRSFSFPSSADRHSTTTRSAGDFAMGSEHQHSLPPSSAGVPWYNPLPLLRDQ